MLVEVPFSDEGFNAARPWASKLQGRHRHVEFNAGRVGLLEPDLECGGSAGPVVRKLRSFTSFYEFLRLFTIIYDYLRFLQLLLKKT